MIRSDTCRRINIVFSLLIQRIDRPGGFMREVEYWAGAKRLVGNCLVTMRRGRMDNDCHSSPVQLMPERTKSTGTISHIYTGCEELTWDCPGIGRCTG